MLLVQFNVNADCSVGHLDCTSQHAGGIPIASKCSWPQVRNARSSGHDTFRFGTRHLIRRRMWPLFLRAGAEIPTDNTDPYIVRVRNAGGFKKYEQAHITRITAILAPTPRLPPEMVRKIVGSAPRGPLRGACHMLIVHT